MSLSLHELIYGSKSSGNEDSNGNSIQPDPDASAAEHQHTNRDDENHHEGGSLADGQPTSQSPERSTSLFKSAGQKRSRHEDDGDDDTTTFSSPAAVVAANTTTATAASKSVASTSTTEASASTLHETKNDDMYSSTAKRLKVLYSQTASNDSTATAAAAASLATATAATKMQHALQPPIHSYKEKPKKIHYKKYYPKNTHLSVLASTDEIKERELKQQRHVDWRYIRHRWKKRRLDLRHEVDVGNAIQKGMRHVVTTQLQQEKEAQAKKKPPPDDATAEEKVQDYVDTSEEEQENIRSQLMKASQEAAAAAKAKASSAQTDNEKEDLRPYEEKMDFWELGHTQPNNRKQILGYMHRVASVVKNLPDEAAQKQLPAAQPHNASIDKDGSSSGDDESIITLRRLAGTLPTFLQETCPYFPLNHNVYASPGYTHRRQLIRLAARHVAAAVGNDDNDENRLIEAIWHSDFYEARFQSTLRYSLMERGTNLHTFYTHLWKDRKGAVRELGVSQELQLAGPSSYHGYTMERNDQIWRRHRRSLERTASAGRIEWSPEESKTKKGRYIHLAPTTLYVPVPGTIPPVPCFPLDETGMIFGPPDEYGDYVSYGSIDEQTLRMTTASLLRRYAVADRTQRGFYRNQLRSMSEKLTELNTNTGVQFNAMFTKGMYVSLPQLYMAWMGLLSLELNGIFQISSPREEEVEIVENLDERSEIEHEYNTQEYEDDNENEAEEHGGVRATAARLYQYRDIVEKSQGLERFGRLHFTFGLLQIAKDLPESAAEIFSRPLDGLACRTPFDVFRRVLEHLEEKGHLVEDSMAKTSLDFVGVGELEFSFYRTIQIFAKCIEHNPTDVSFHSWHLATLAASLLLCSGNRIGSGAHLYPSQLSKTMEQQIHESFPEEEDRDAVDHEVRRMLPKFHDLRRDTARALELLVRVEEHQKGPHSQLAISSFLEWKEVIALLLGPGCGTAILADLCLVHAYYRTHWALNDNTSKDLLRTDETNSSNKTAKVEASARELEQNPHDINNWRALVEALGPVGTKSLEGKQCASTDCKACRMLRSGLFVDHENEQRRESEPTWWGYERQKWWDSVLLDLNPSYTTIPSYAKNLYTSLESEFSSLEPMKALSDDSGKQLDSKEVQEVFSKILERPLATIDKVAYAEEKSTEEERTQIINEYLPQMYCEQVKTSDSGDHVATALPRFTFGKTTNERNTRNASVDSSLYDPAWVQLEIECYRVVIACHLYSPGHEWVRWKVTDLAAKCWGDKAVKHSFKRDRDELQALKWLYQLNISAVGAVRIAVSEKCEQRKAREQARESKNCDSSLPGGKPKPRKGRKKDPNAPKRAMPPHFYYSREVRQKVKEESPHLSFGQLGKRIAEMYRELSVDEKKKYEELTKKDRERYHKEMAEYRASIKKNNTRMDNDTEGAEALP